MKITGERKEGGYIDPAELALIDGLPNGEVVVFDVGANVGEFTEAVLERRGEAHVYAFDPNPDCRSELFARFSSPSPPPLRGIVVLGGLSDKAERREFHTDAPTSQLGTFFPRDAVPMGTHYSVTTDTIANVVAEYRIPRIDYLKLDCEGSELDVLRGAAGVLDRIDLVSWEQLPPHAHPYTDATIADFEAVLGADFEVTPLGVDDPELALLWVARRQ